ncbi:ester cyclase [Amycolatopsis sp. La24]|uniref:ester cyclase n=1 Tax=Amycolatopsis sp. La24 TaxID=3028304 RepID=UPI0023AFE350|nr:ester cyclase [Amycolatopsis sp. La24]
MTDPKTVLRRFLAIVNSHDLAELDTVVAEDVIESGPVVVDAPTGGLAAFRTGWTQMLTAFPDLRVDVDSLLAEDDRVAATVTLTATNTGYYRRGFATGKNGTWRGFVLARVTDGRIAELDIQTDRLAILQQLGIVGDDDELAAARQPS